MHHRQREHAVGSRADRQPLIRQGGGARTVRVNHDQACTFAPSFLNERPEMNAVAVNIGRPGHNQACLGKILRCGAQLGPIHTHQRGCARCGTDRPVQLRRPKPVKEPAIHRSVAKLSNGACIAIGQNALRPVLLADPLQTRRDLIKRLIP